MNRQLRRPLVTISLWGVSYLHRQNPYIVIWWSAVFPGFGQYFLHQYLRGTLFTLSELIANTLSHVNEAIVYSFCGQFELAKSVLQPKWVFGYLIIYFYAMWDSYRTTLVQNKLCHLAELANERIKSFIFHPLEIQYLDQKNPLIAALCSFFFPGLGQLYNNRWGLAFYAMFWWWFYLTLSRAHESFFNLCIGNVQESISMLHRHWLLFMPSVLGGSIYHAFKTAIEHNQLYRLEQRQYLTERYRNSKVRIFL